ncbi:MAG: helix-turn-helix domain-containing protein [Alphaproteobacteria bacterium]|jgi:CRP-like cAMP-binding protein|nr:helix-turn-helix domain-containing protein [Alphaproteobacteria bacterium]MBF0356754.1 helix-turn-helix domain-containing protein [Alphaproteobacteria bacterium]
MSGLSPSDLDLASKAPLFSGVERADLAALLSGSNTVSYARQTLIFSQGDKADRFFIILDGQVNLYAMTKTGQQSIIEVFSAVTTFAEAAIFSPGEFPLNCEVLGGTRLIHVPAPSFLKHLSQNPHLAMILLKGLARWQARMTEEIAQIKSRSPAQRLASFLLTFAPENTKQARLRLPLTKVTLASRIGIAPESLSRALARMKSVGVESRGRDIIITDREALRRFLHEGGN